MSDVYREKVGSLCLALEAEESRIGAVDAIRALIEAIVLEPDGERLNHSEGRFGRKLSAARPPSHASLSRASASAAGAFGGGEDSKRSPETGDLSLQVEMVAGAGFEPATFGL